LKYLGNVEFFAKNYKRSGKIRSILADFPGYYAIFLVIDNNTKEEFIVDSRQTY